MGRIRHTLAPIEVALQDTLGMLSKDLARELAKDLVRAVREETHKPSFSSRLRTLRQFATENVAYNERKLRRLVETAEINGLAKHGAIIKQGGRVYIHIDRFDTWARAGTLQPSSTPLLRNVVQ